MKVDNYNVKYLSYLRGPKFPSRGLVQAHIEFRDDIGQVSSHLVLTMDPNAYPFVVPREVSKMHVP